MNRLWFYVALLAACSDTTAPPPTAALTGNVVIAAGESIANLIVTAIGPTPASTVTDAAGRYVLTDLVPGLYRVCAVVPSTAELESCARAEVVDANSTAPDLTPTPLGAVSGRIIAPDGSAIPAAWVGAAGEQPIAISDGDGRFTLRGLTAGTRQLYAVKSGYQPLVERTVEITWQDTLALGQLTLAAETQPLTNLAATVERIGPAENAPGDETIEVTIDPIGRNVVCDASGHFETLVPAGVYALTITAPRRRLLLPRVLVGDGRAYIVQNDFRALDTLVMPIGEQQAGRVGEQRVELGGTRLVRQVDLADPGGRGVEIWSLPDRVLQYQHPVRTGLTMTRNGRLYFPSNAADGISVQLTSVDLATYQETIAIPALAAAASLELYRYESGGLVWNQSGALVDLDNGQTIYQAPSNLASLPARDAVDADHFALRFSDHIEGRSRADGSLQRNYVTKIHDAKLYLVGDRWFVLETGRLSSIAADSTATVVAEGASAPVVIGDQLLYSQRTSPSEQSHQVLYRPSDGRMRTWANVFLAAPFVFVSNDGLAYSMRRLDDLDHELQLVPYGMPQRPDDPRYVLFGNGRTDLGANWIAVELATGASIDLGFGRGATQSAAPSVVEGRFFVITDVFGNGGPGTLRERFGDGTTRTLATDVYWFAISPHATRIVYNRLGLDRKEMVAQSLAPDGPATTELFARETAFATWLSDDLLAWRTDGPAQPSLQEPGDYLTSFSD